MWGSIIVFGHMGKNVMSSQSGLRCRNGCDPMLLEIVDSHDFDNGDFWEEYECGMCGATGKLRVSNAAGSQPETTVTGALNG
jgi:hypothetical protein